MQIQCPSCRARTDVADHHQGEKVRCTECGCLHVARPTEEQGRVRWKRRRRLLVASVAVLALASAVFSVCARGAQPVATAAREAAGQRAVERGFPGWYKKQLDIPLRTSEDPTAVGGPALTAPAPEPPSPEDQDD